LAYCWLADGRAGLYQAGGRGQRGGAVRKSGMAACGHRSWAAGWPGGRAAGLYGGGGGG